MLTHGLTESLPTETFYKRPPMWPRRTQPNAAHKLSQSCRDFGSVDCGYEEPVSYLSDRVWALRNICKKLYVRSDGIPTIDREKNLSYANYNGLRGFPGLGHALLTNIVWSDDTSTAMQFSDVQGSWVGDRVDVRLMDDVWQKKCRRRDGRISADR